MVPRRYPTSFLGGLGTVTCPGYPAIEFLSNQDSVSYLTRALAIREQALGPMHPDTATSLWWLATLYEQQKAYEQAEPLYRQAVAIFEQVVGSTHPNTKNIRAYYVALLEKMKHEGETQP
jgi:tetratricopeptide (TPR) repeat protein